MNIQDYLKIKKAGRTLAAALKNHPVGSLLVLAFLFAVYAMIIFGANAVNEAPPAPAATNLQVNRELYERVLARLKARDANIQRGIEQNYPDIFR